MALYKDGQKVRQSNDVAFDRVYEPGAAAPHAGIYRCVECREEIGIAEGHVLPPQNHHQHATGLGPIRWKFLVYAEHQKR